MLEKEGANKALQILPIKRLLASNQVAVVNAQNNLDAANLIYSIDEYFISTGG